MNATFSPNESDETIIAMAKVGYEQMSKAELVAYYNKQRKLGIVGVRRQTLHMIALHEVLQERFGYSPFRVEGAVIIGFGEAMEEGESSL